MSLDEIVERVGKAAVAAGRKPRDITLIAVSKKQPPPRVAAVLESGHRVFGENRLQEAQGRWSDLRQSHDDLVLHLIGPLQTNKVRAAMALFDAIHSVDRERLAETIARIADETGGCPELFLQVNTGAEPQKSGIEVAGVAGLVGRCRDLGLPVKGLMCIPPEADDPAPHFDRLARLAGDLGLPGLSMGMSADFETAIAHGATHIRVGSAIFGERPT